MRHGPLAHLKDDRDHGLDCTFEVWGAREQSFAWRHRLCRIVRMGACLRVAKQRLGVGQTACMAAGMRPCTLPRKPTVQGQGIPALPAWWNNPYPPLPPPPSPAPTPTIDPPSQHVDIISPASANALMPACAGLNAAVSAPAASFTI